jgi:hypothetical protein
MNLINYETFQAVSFVLALAWVVYCSTALIKSTVDRIKKISGKKHRKKYRGLVG